MGTPTLATTAIRQLLDITGTNEELIDTAIQNIHIPAAVDQYSSDRPLVARYERIGNDEHELPFPSDWINHASEVFRIESPAGNQVPEYLDPNNFIVEYVDTTARTCDNSSSGASSVTLSTASEAGYFKDGELVTVGDDSNTETNWCDGDGNATTGVVTLKNTTSNNYSTNPDIAKQSHITLFQTAPSSSDVIAVEYTTNHTFSASSDTIPPGDLEAVYYLMASLVAKSLSARYAKKQDTNMDADSINFQQKSTEWREVAEAMRMEYDRLLGQAGEEEATKAAGIIGDADLRYQWGRKFLWHGNRFR